ncbi:trypsin inhibitor-like [Leptopilina heterotoma]|uniref:trypsin inhibitor-like n=1 Tax=Leptopilina heterotoma TaxID=63436 RepID=UPI001CA8DD9B|nr:trypsin inhibitor-like [Leptopilina heterotoma]
MNYKSLGFFFLLCFIIMMEFGLSNGQTDRERVCRQPIVTGSCRGYFPRFAYVPSERSCQRFIYGGCNGNLNNFEYLIHCEMFCEGVN